MIIDLFNDNSFRVDKKDKRIRKLPAIFIFSLFLANKYNLKLYDRNDMFVTKNTEGMESFKKSSVAKDNTYKARIFPP